MTNAVSRDSAVLAALSPELQTLIRGLQGHPPGDDAHLDWAYLCRLALAHGIAPLLHRAWTPLHEVIPAALFSDLTVLRRQNRKHGLLGLRQRDDVLQILNDGGVQSIVLKGAAWARVWYGDVSLRPFNDIDLLLPAGQLPRARQLLHSAGYYDTGAWGASHHDIPLELPDSPCAVELHRYLLALPASQPLTFEDIEGRSMTLSGKDALVRTLDCEDVLLHLCMHLLQHIESEPGWRLLHAWDIAQHVRACAVNWEVFDHRTRQTGVQDACRAALGLAHLLTGVEFPAILCDMESGIRLVAFPLMRYSLSPVRHRGILSLIDVLSRPQRWHVAPVAVGGWLRRRVPANHQTGTVLAEPRLDAPSFSLRYHLWRELWWLIQETLNTRAGNIRQGMQQIRWEHEAQRMIHDLLPLAPQIGQETGERIDNDAEDCSCPLVP